MIILIHKVIQIKYIKVFKIMNRYLSTDGIELGEYDGSLLGLPLSTVEGVDDVSLVGADDGSDDGYDEVDSLGVVDDSTFIDDNGFLSGLPLGSKEKKRMVYYLELMMERMTVLMMDKY